MKIIRLKRILSLLIVFTLSFSINHNISIVKAQESISFLTGVSLTDDKNNDLAGKKVKPDSKVSIVYTYEIGANNGDVTTDVYSNLSGSITNTNVITNVYSDSSGTITDIIPPQTPTKRTYKVNIPKEFDLSKTSNFSVFDDKGLNVGEASVDSSTNTVNIEFNVSGTLKGEFRIDTVFNKNFASGTKEINFNLGNGKTALIKVNIISPNLALGLGKRSLGLNFFTSVKLTDKSEKPLGTNVGASSEVRVAYEYKIPESGIDPESEYTFDFPIEIIGGCTYDILGEDGKSVAGTISVDKLDDATYSHTATLKFTQYALDNDYLLSGSTGEFYLESTFDKEKIQNGGKKTIDLFYDKEDVYFALNQVTPKVDLKVEGEQLTTPGDYKKIQWTITVTPTIENAWIYDDKTLSNFTILNPIGDNLTYVLDSEVMKLGTEDYTSYSFNDTELSWTFNSFNFEDFVDVGEKPVFTITFETEISSNAWNNSDGSDKATFKNKASSTYEYSQYELDTDGYAQYKSDPTKGESESNEKSVDITTKLLNKDGRLLAGADEIEWTIYLNQESFSLSDATIKDTITVNGTIPINMDIKYMEIYEAKVANGKLEKDGSGTPITPTITGNVFEHNLGAIDSPKIITYKTTVDASYKEDNNTKNFKNEVILNDGTMNLKKEKTVELGKHLIKKSGSPDRTDHTILWTINLNTESMDLGASTVIDEIP